MPSPAREGSNVDGSGYRLVCGCCEAVLEGVLASRAQASEAGDDHATEVHPDREEGVIVIAAPGPLARAHEESIVRFTVDAQRRLAQRASGEDVG